MQVTPALDEQNTVGHGARRQGHGALSDLDALLGGDRQILCAVLYRADSPVGPLEAHENPVPIVPGGGRRREPAHAVPTVRRSRDLQAVAVGGMEDYLPHGGLNGMVNAVLGFVDEQKTTLGVGQCQRDPEEAHCPIAQASERDGTVAALQPYRDPSAILSAPASSKHRNALHFVREHEVEGRYSEVLMFGERDIVPKACGVFRRERFRADGFALGSRREVVPVAEVGVPRYGRVADIRLVEFRREEFVGLTEKRGFQDLRAAGGTDFGCCAAGDPIGSEFRLDSERLCRVSRPDSDGVGRVTVPAVEQRTEIERCKRPVMAVKGRRETLTPLD